MKSIFSNINNELKKLAKYNFKISYDFSDKYYKYDFNEKNILSFIDYGFFSFDNFPEDKIYKFINKIQNNYEIEIIVTAGKNGSYTINEGKEIHVPAKKISPVDTIGAGDAYITYYLLSRLNETDKKKAMEKGGEYASKICMNRGSFGYSHKL